MDRWNTVCSDFDGFVLFHTGSLESKHGKWSFSNMRNNLIRRFTERPAPGFHSSFRRTPESRVEARGRQPPHQSKTSAALDPGLRRDDAEVA
ncbi:MAG: hypothetical protein GY833_02650 [Aestuariibacter sp.]|nr:hypothetical protein [Aestuariibacter sp.]